MPNHKVVTAKCGISLIVDESKPPYLEIYVELVNGVITKFALSDQDMLRRMATDILEELPAPKKRKTAKKRSKKAVH